jgi:hypothetical protein
MKNKGSSDTQSIRIIRWTARIISILIISLFLLFFIGESVTEHHPNAEPIAIINIVVGVLMIGGLVVAWKWEFLGGLISVIGFIGVGIVNPRSFTLPMMYLFLLPAILFLICAWKSRSLRSADNETSRND